MQLLLCWRLESWRHVAMNSSSLELHSEATNDCGNTF